MTESIKTYIPIDSSCSSWHFDCLIWTKNLLCEKLIPHFSQNSAPKTSKICGVNYFGQYSSWHRQIIVQSIHYVQLVQTFGGKPLFKFPSTWTIHAKSMCFFKVFVFLVPPVYRNIIKCQVFIFSILNKYKNLAHYYIYLVERWPNDLNVPLKSTFSRCAF